MKYERNWCIVQLSDGRMATTDLPMNIKEGDYCYTEINKFIGSIGDTKVKLMKIMIHDFDSEVMKDLVTDKPRNGKCYENDELVLKYLPEYGDLVHSVGTPFEDDNNQFRLVLVVTQPTVSITSLNTLVILPFSSNLDINFNDKFTPGYVVGIGTTIYEGDRSLVITNVLNQISELGISSILDDFKLAIDPSDIRVHKVPRVNMINIRLATEYTLPVK